MIQRTFVIAAILLWSMECFAHVFPVRAEPRVGAVLNHAPTCVCILFDGAVEPSFSTIRVFNGNKMEVDKRDCCLDSTDPKRLKVSLRPKLPMGEYRVDWVAVARDGHRTLGHFSFRIESRHE